MRKILNLALMLLAGISIAAQSNFSLVEGASTLLYSLPKTELCITVTTEKVTQKPGMFYRYSERYLATNKVITEEKSSYKIKNVDVKTRAIPDTARTFSFTPTKNSALCHLSVTADGLLNGINVPVENTSVVVPLSDNAIADISQPAVLLPLGEEYMMAGSEAKLAEGAAKQIYRIRESRLGILTADVEKLPADGVSFKSMMEGLNKMEKELTELFIGKITVETQTHKFFFIPDTTLNNKVLFRLSAQKGIVPATDLSGNPYYMNVRPASIKTIPADPKAKKDIIGLYTVLPASTSVSIGDGINNYFLGQFFIPQFGKIVPLSESLFKQPKTKLKVDVQTGRLLTIE